MSNKDNKQDGIVQSKTRQMTVVKAMVEAAKMMFSPTSINNIQALRTPIYFS
jgi:hypothetical protein